MNGHYAGEGEKASAELGKVITEHRVSAIAETIKAIKADTRTLKIQNQYFEEVEEMSSKN